nr:immunoglobulin heavy chain junction region [Mus musculus]
CARDGTGTLDYW